MGKDSAFLGVGSFPSFEYSSDAVYCYACIFRLEKMLGNDISVSSLLSYFGIDWQKVKTTRTSDFCSVQSDEISRVIEKYNKAKEIYLECQDYSVEQISVALIDAKENNANPLRIAALADLLTIREKKIGTRVPERLLKLVFLSRNYDKSLLKNKLLLMNDDCCMMSLSSFFANKTVRNILFLLNIDKFEDLLYYDIDFIYPLFINSFEYLINIVESFDRDVFEDFEVETNYIIEKINQKNPIRLDIFKKRNQIGENRKYTLEELGEVYSLTRERIRQIEAKTKELIIKYGEKLEGIVSMLLLSCLKKDSYVSKASLLDRFSDTIYADYLAAFVNCFFNNDFEYEESLECFLKKGDASNIQDELISEYPVAITMEEYSHFDVPKKKMVGTLYNLMKANIYIRKGVTFSDFVLLAFDELFPNGGRISVENCVKLSQYLLEKYDIVFEPNSHTLQSYLSRNNYCFVDRGTFINRKYAATIEEEFARKIISYILSNEGIVYYLQIFDVFKEEFLKHGINNRFYVKGVIDPLLPSTIRTKKDYCCRSSYDGNVTTHFEDLFSRYNGVLTLNDFLKENPGVKDYILFNYANKNINKILWLSDKTFIDTEYINIPHRAAILIREEIKYLFKTMNTNVITDSKLYVRIKHLYPEIMEDMPYIKNAFDLYSLARFLLAEEFFFSRPFISKDNENSTYARVVSNYLRNLDRFDLHTVQSFLSRMHLRLYNYLDLLIYMSDDFVQITKDACINKKVFQISQNNLSDIKDSLNYYINSFGEMDLRKFNGYSTFPKLKYNWSQYLLVGIVTTFFSELFDVEYTDGQYNLTSYIIRRR